MKIVGILMSLSLRCNKYKKPWHFVFFASTSWKAMECIRLYELIDKYSS